jgi:hypothetical protein
MRSVDTTTDNTTHLALAELGYSFSAKHGGRAGPRRANHGKSETTEVGGFRNSAEI